MDTNELLFIGWIEFSLRITQFNYYDRQNVQLLWSTPAKSGTILVNTRFLCTHCWSIFFVLLCSWIFWLQKIGNGRLSIHIVKVCSQKALMPFSQWPSSVYLQDLRIVQPCTGWFRYLNLKSWPHALVTSMILTRTESPGKHGRHVFVNIRWSLELLPES